MMAKYRKVDPRIWNDAKFMGLSDAGKLALFFVLTHPNMTAVGAMRHTIPGMAAELGWSSEAFREAFREGCAKGIVKHDERASFVWLPNFIKYNQPESPNVVKAWFSALDLLPECQMRNELIQHVKDFLKGFAKGFQEGFAEATPKSMPNQEQEQEQKEELSEKLSVSHDSISLPCEDGSEFVYPDKYLAEARKAYPLVDIPSQVSKARAWLEANAGRKKTRRGMTKFLNGWLARAQVDAEKRTAKDAPPQTTGSDITAEQMLPAKWLRAVKA
ncbi:MAG: hypothetical protein RBR38_10480 [Desulfomicrobium apsheronum]|nr:hypothetical protein [Desulfomicrobium apsheronum]